MSYDLDFAAAGLCAQIDQVISALENGLRMHHDLHDLEALELALYDLENAKALIMLALCGKDKAH
jgi:hypothetical protein